MSKFTQEEIIDKMQKHPIIPLFYNGDEEFTIRIVEACFKGGVRLFEFTNRGPEAEKVFKSLAKHVHEHLPEMALGIGTIFNKRQAEKFVAINTDFIVQPVTSADVAEVCRKEKILWIPGVQTTTEIYQAQLLGAEVVKLFPADIVGPHFIRSVKGPMPTVKIMVTGGVEPNDANLKEWFSSGAFAVGLGSKLFNKVSTEKDIEQLISLLQDLNKNLKTLV